MKLLTSVLPRGRILTDDGWFTLAVCGFFIGLEVIGRYAALTDFHDGLAGFALLVAIAAIVARHRRAPLGWVTSLTNWAQRLGVSLSTLKYDHGIDLRGTPPLPRRTPPAVWVIAAGLILWAGIAAASWTAFPTGWRVIGVYSSYTLYLGFLMALWCVLLAVTFIGVFVPVAVLDSLLKRWLGDTDRRGAELAAVVGYAILVSGIAWKVPPAAILGLCAVIAFVAWLVYLPRGNDGPAVLWRAAPDRPVYAVPVRRLLALVAMLGSLLMFAILLTACGGRLFDPPASDDAMPVTALFGAIAAWLVPILALVVAGRLWSAQRNDPARRTRPTVHIAGADRQTIRQAAKILRTWGYSTRTSPTREKGQLGVELVAQELSEAKEFDPRWPLKVSLEDLIAGEVKQRLDRRDEIHVRRQLFRSLQKLFKRASAFKGPGGGGFWLAPHWWFVEGVGREDSDASGEDSAPPLVGPPYSRAIPARARQHAHAVLRATEIDMIFIEDGVTFKNLERVLRTVTELYDVHGGKRKAEELHFRGVPKVKVMIHEYEPGNPFESELYPEPKFDDLSRVRVLHVFRDRGGEEELIEPPYDFSWTPAPALMS